MDDYEQIRQLTYAYALAIDCGRVSDHLALWTEDASLDYSPIGLAHLVGRDEIVRFFARVAEALTSSCHLTSNHIIELAGDNATGTCYWQTESRTSTGGATHSTGCYMDRFRRVDGRWRIRSRRCEPLNPPRLHDLSALLHDALG